MSNNLLEDARRLLEASGYAVHVARPDDPSFHFEDDSLLGFVRVFDRADEIISGWRDEQDSFLRRHAASLLRDPVKAWNLYALLLTRAPAPEDVTRELFAIEEDFQSARKIARGGIRTRDELAVVLGPLLPIQTELALAPTDVHARVLQRLGPEGSPLRLLLSAVPPEDIARALSGLSA